MTEGIGNAEQVRAVAEQLFDIWKAEQARDQKDRHRWFGGNIAGWAAMLGMAATVIATFVDVRAIAVSASSRSIQNENAITAMKADNGDRLARIETKIDLMMEERAR